MEPITDTLTLSTTLTCQQPLLYVGLASGNVAAVAYTVSFGDIVLSILLLAMVVLQVVQMWRSGAWTQ